ncbi:TrbG/VirB9 family P-type conjugative transfer protein [Thiotrichales bacterium 19S11-10]|nr:TrbG/VirB9 family P-type conjugative transfer protein [Thiotrichales bacterium 19S11-10]
MYKTVFLIFLAFVVGLVGVAQAEQEINLDEMSFNYQIDPQKGSKPIWYPLSVFSDGNKTYIEFPEGINANNMPEVYIKSLNENQGIPVWNWSDHYLVVNQLVKVVKLMKGHRTITITNKRNPTQYIAPPPKYTARDYQGYGLYYLVGVGKNDSASFSSLSTRLAIDYNWALSRNWLLGMGLAGYYMPGLGASSSDYKNLNKYGGLLYLKPTYLFFNGFYLNSVIGLGYSKDSWKDKNTDEEQSKSGVQPELSLGGGYLVNKSLSFDINVNYMFKSGGLFSNISLLLGVGYHF